MWRGEQSECSHGFFRYQPLGKTLIRAKSFEERLVSWRTGFKSVSIAARLGSQQLKYSIVQLDHIQCSQINACLPTSDGAFPHHKIEE